MPDTRTEPQTAAGPPEEPLTEAGRQLIADQMAGDPRRWVQSPWELARRVRLIERQAVRAALRDTPESPVAAEHDHTGCSKGEHTCPVCHAAPTPREADTNVGDGWAPDEYGGVLPSGGPE